MVIGWVVLIVAAGATTGALLGGVLNNDIEFTNEPESVRAQNVIDERFTQEAAGASTEYVIISSDEQTVDDDAFRAYVGELQAALAAREDIAAAPPASFYDVAAESEEAAAGLVSASRTATLLPVEIVDDEAETVENLRDVLADHRSDTFTTQVAGQATLFADFSEIAEEDARKGESIGVAVALIVLVIVFGAIVAAWVPIWMAIVSIVVSLGLVSGIGQLVEFNLFVVNIISMIGLAVGIDYSLFIVSRYREERKKGSRSSRRSAPRGHGESRGVLQQGHGGPRAHGHVHPADDDLPEPRLGRDLRHVDVAAGGDDPAPRPARAPRRLDGLAVDVVCRRCCVRRARSRLRPGGRPHRRLGGAGPVGRGRVDRGLHRGAILITRIVRRSSSGIVQRVRRDAATGDPIRVAGSGID